MLTTTATRHLTTAVYRLKRRPLPSGDSDHERLSLARRQAKLVFAFWSTLYFALQVLPIYSPLVASLTLVVVVLTWLSWLLATFSFFLDKWLVPIAVALVCALIVFPSLRGDDYVFPVAPQPKVGVRTLPSEVVRSDGRPFVVIAAAGGGIQASAWTARVLRNLSDKIPEFRSRLRLVSAVSGGSVGTMFYLNDEILLTRNRSRTPTAIRNADREALDAVAFGFAFRDLWRPIWSVIAPATMRDRGYFLERSWARDCQVCDWPLSALREDVGNSTLPNFIFNGTIVELGTPAYLGTAHVPSANPIVDHLSGWDISLVTAARMSATFPWVSPAARPITLKSEAPVIDGKPIRYHIVDGGYYDNYGVATLVDVIDGGLMHRQLAKLELPKRIILINIQASSSAEAGNNSLTTLEWQSLMPIKTLLRVRDAAQRAQGQVAIDRLVRRWRRDGVTISQVPAIFPLPNVPLSWRLTQQQILALNGSAAEQTLQNLVATTRDYLLERPIDKTPF